MTKFEKLFNDVDGILQKTRLFPKAYMLTPKGHIKNRGFDRTEEGGDRNEYGNGWNDATMELTNLITEVLDKWEKNGKI